MAGKLLTDSQLLAIQKTAILGMQTEVTILRGDPDTGLDLTDDPYGSSPGEPTVVAPPIGGVKGWLHSHADPDRHDRCWPADHRQHLPTMATGRHRHPAT